MAEPSAPPAPYGRATVALHWLMLLLLVLVYATIELREAFPRGSGPREALKTWHFMLGLSVFALVWVRLAARRSRAGPGGGAATPVAARAVHALLYLFMIAMPVAGWVILSAAGDPIPFFGLQLPALVGPNALLAERVEDLHATIGKAGYFLIGFHVLAALFHHYALKDGTLRRMLPAAAGRR